MAFILASDASLLDLRHPFWGVASFLLIDLFVSLTALRCVLRSLGLNDNNNARV